MISLCLLILTKRNQHKRELITARRKITTITIYFINPRGKLKLSFDRTTKNISIIISHEPDADTHS